MRRWIALASLLLAAAPAVASPLRVFVVMGEGGAIARAITDSATCPDVTLDGRAMPMTLRFAVATMPQRPTASLATNSKPSAFPVTVCDAALPSSVRRASIAGVRLPLPHRVVRRIVVIGDTGCRLKAADSAYQPCNDPAKFAFARIAASAARARPDLIVHVGDYHYRENPCPDDNAGCAGSPWGYGWDAWAADFFTPAAPLLAVAPLAPVRGNHESCNRGGQGWWRFLDGHRRADGHDCDDAANDHAGDWSPPVAVPLGNGAQLVLLDLAIEPNKAMADGDWRAPLFDATWTRLAELAKAARFTFAANHQPILGFSATTKSGAVTLIPGSAAIQSVFGRHGPRQLPPDVDVLLSGHYHLWEQVGFAGDVPSQFITGFSGTVEDLVPLPAALPLGAAPAPGLTVTDFASWVDGFGYMVLDRRSARSWRATVHAADGRVVNRCTITGTRSHCAVVQVAPGAPAT